MIMVVSAVENQVYMQFKCKQGTYLILSENTDFVKNMSLSLKKT